MVPAPDDVTLGEIARNLAALRTDMGDRFQQVNQRLDSLEYVPRGEYQLKVEQLSDDIKELQGSKQWMSRALVTALVLPALVAAFVGLVFVR
jgi:hypothetical protein